MSRRRSTGPRGLDVFASCANASFGAQRCGWCLRTGPRGSGTGPRVSWRSSDQRGGPEVCRRVPREANGLRRRDVAPFGARRRVDVGGRSLTEAWRGLASARLGAPRSARARWQLEVELFGARSRVRGRQTLPRRRGRVPVPRCRRALRSSEAAQQLEVELLGARRQPGTPIASREISGGSEPVPEALRSPRVGR